MSGLDFLYGTAAGRALLRPLTARALSRAAGKLLDTSASRAMIPLFVRRAGIDTEEYDLSGVRSFNDFFRRPLKAGRRTIDADPSALIAPCDGLLTAVPITRDTVLSVKQSRWTVSRLLNDGALAREFENGVCLRKASYGTAGGPGKGAGIHGKLP